MIRLEKGQHRPGPVLRARMAEVTEQPESLFSEDGEEDSDLPAALRNAITELTRMIVRSQA